MTQHTIVTEIEVEDRADMAYPMLEITYDYQPGYTDPPGDPRISFREAKVIAADGVMNFPFRDMAEKWLLGPGFAYACDCAETDLLATRAAHMEYRREQ